MVLPVSYSIDRIQMIMIDGHPIEICPVKTMSFVIEYLI